MNTAELIVEIVLTGLLMLAILLLPTWVRDERTMALGGEVAIVLAIGGGFMLGVVVDRCCDSIIERWEARSRLAYADEIAKERDALPHQGELRDSFPESWLRNQLLRAENQSALRQVDQIRVRMRISRTVMILTPALATSWILAVWGTPTARLLPAVHLALLLVASLASTRLEAPRTKAPSTRDPKRLLWRSPATLWFALQMGFALFAGIAACCARPGKLCILPYVAVAGVVLTLLAYRAWARITRTFQTFVWEHSLHGDPEGLAKACFAFPTPPESPEGTSRASRTPLPLQ